VDAEVREAAIRAVPPEVDWRALLASEVNTAIRVAITVQLTKTAREEAIPTLIALLNSDHWQERANAAACLTSLGPAVVEAIKPLLHRARQSVRAAALRVLFDLGQGEWLGQQSSI
jgi:HEAT repeat protein